MKLTDKSRDVFTYVKDNGGKVSVDELCAGLDRTARSVNANVTDLSKKGLVIREKVAAASKEEKDITYVCITPAGADFVETEDEAEAK